MTVDLETGSSHIIIGGVVRFEAQLFGRPCIHLAAYGHAHSIYFDTPIDVEVGTVPARFREEQRKLDDAARTLGTSFGREYEAGEVIPAPEPRGTEKGSDFPLPEDDCTMGVPASADSEPVRRRRTEC